MGSPTWTDLVLLSVLAGSPGSPGASVELQKSSTHIQWRLVGGTTWTNLVALADIAGARGPSGLTLVGTVVIGQQATLLALQLGIKELTVPLAGAVVGERYIGFIRSFRLTGSGAFTPGRPAGYAMVDAACLTAGQITLSHNTPALALLSQYWLTVDVCLASAS